MPEMTRGLPSTSPRMYSGKVLWLTRLPSTSTNAKVAPLSASGRAPKIGSIAPGPTAVSRATAFCVSELVGSDEDRISVMSRSARKFVKKLIQPFRRPSSLRTSSRPAATEQNAWAQVRGLGWYSWPIVYYKEQAARTSVNYAIALSAASPAFVRAVSLPTTIQLHSGLRACAGDFQT